MKAYANCRSDMTLYHGTSVFEKKSKSNIIPGHKACSIVEELGGGIILEIHGEKGSIYFDYERRDELKVYFASNPGDKRGFRIIYTGPMHPNGEALWPISALGIGFSEIKIIECHDFIKAIADNTEASPNFEDGYKIVVISDSVIKSANKREWIKIKFE